MNNQEAAKGDKNATPERVHNYKPKVGDLVFAKVKGYPPWPARIEPTPPQGMKLTSGKYPVFFFGTYENAILGAKDLYPYFDFKDKMGNPKKLKCFKEGIWEIENTPNMERPGSKVEESNSNQANEDVSAEAEDPVNTDNTPTSVTMEQSANDSSLNFKMSATKSSSSVKNSTHGSESDEGDEKLIIDETPSGPKPLKSGKKSEYMVKEKVKKTAKSKPNVSKEQNVGSKKNNSILKRSRSGRMIKRKKFSSDEEDVDEEPELVKAEEKIGTHIETEPKQMKLKEVTSKPESKESKRPAKLLKVKVEKHEESSSSSSNNNNNDNNNNQSQNINENTATLGADKEDSVTSDTSKSELYYQKLKLKIEEKEKEKERRKMEKLEKKRKERLEKLKNQPVSENVLRDIHREIVESLNISKTDIGKCIHALNKLDVLQISQNDLCNNREIIQTLKKCRKYKGDENVRLKSEYLYSKFKLTFLNGLEEGLNMNKLNDIKSENSIEQSNESVACDVIYSDENKEYNTNKIISNGGMESDGTSQLNSK